MIEGKTWISMYDMALVQTGFMGAITITPQSFGMDLTPEEVSNTILYARSTLTQEHPYFLPSTLTPSRSRLRLTSIFGVVVAINWGLMIGSTSAEVVQYTHPI